MVKKKESVKKVEVPDIKKITFGIGETKNIGNFESIKVYNELEAVLREGEKISDVQRKLREMVVLLNERDFNALLGK